ncbi:MAG: glycosyltransferase 87 family protein [Candidatus Hinthialibacter antarcticus]|nr:glycosyltransferase 87 family protein [Candidatus Hinthialibacter antarcticus]
MTQTSSPVRGAVGLITLGVLSALGYVYLFRLSLEDLSPRTSQPELITLFLITYFILFGLYLLLITPLVWKPGLDPRHLWFGIAFGLLFRAILLPSDLILENDIYRYLWDGHTQHQGVNPYRYAPSEPETRDYRTDYFQQINYKYVPTIYPPTLQMIFFLSEGVYPGSVVGMKFILLIFDALTIFLLLSLLEALNKPPEWCLIYAWSPLVIKEVANSGHADTVSACLLVGFFLLLAKGKPLCSAAVLAAMTLTKFFGVFLLPLLHRQWNYWTYVFFFAAILFLYAPFLAPGVNPFAGFMAFSNEWQFNAGVYELFSFSFARFGGFEPGAASMLTRRTLFALVLLTAAWQALRLYWRPGLEQTMRSTFIVLGALLLCSPVMNPWYLVWMVPLMCVFPNKSWIALTGLVFLSYTYYYDLSFPWWVKATEFGVFFFLLLDDALPWRRNGAPVALPTLSSR